MSASEVSLHVRNQAAKDDAKICIRQRIAKKKQRIFSEGSNDPTGEQLLVVSHLNQKVEIVIFREHHRRQHISVTVHVVDNRALVRWLEVGLILKDNPEMLFYRIF